MSDCERWITKLHALHRQIQPLCGQDAKLTINPPATYLDVERVEIEIGRSLPAELKELFTHCAAKIDFSWSLWSWSPGRAGLLKPFPEELAEVTFGCFDLDLKALPDCWVNWTAWEDCFENPDQYEGGESAYESDDLFPFLSLPNGDVIALVTRGDASGQVVYLSHEGGQFDEAILADSLARFMDTWLELGCPGPECWLLKPFYDWQTERLVATNNSALRWKEILFRTPVVG
jgi:hypothetical protein